MERFFTNISPRIKKRLLIATVAFWVPVLLFIELAEAVVNKDSILFDLPVMDFVQGLATSWLDSFMRVSTNGGNTIVIAIILGLLIGFLYFKNRQRDLMAVLFSVGGAGIINLVLKLLFARERPDLELALVKEGSFSFPSGHAMGSAALGLVLIIMLWRSKLRWPALIVSALYIFIVGISRVYLGAHYPSDVIAGWCMSAAWVLVVYIALEHPSSIKRLLNRIKTKKESK